MKYEQVPFAHAWFKVRACGSVEVDRVHVQGNTVDIIWNLESSVLSRDIGIALFSYEIDVRGYLTHYIGKRLAVYRRH